MIVTTIVESKDFKTFSVEQLTRSLLAHETRLNLVEDSMKQAFEAQLYFSKRRDRGYSGGRKRGRGRSKHHHVVEQWRPSQNQTQRRKPWRKSNVQCYYYKKFGNYEYKCRKKQSDQQRGSVHLSNNKGESSKIMFLLCHLSQGTHNKDLWLLDIGCSNHMIGNKKLLSYLDASITS